MNTIIPSAEDVRARLSPMSYAQVQRLAELSGVPFTTLWKVRGGETKDPRIDTVRQFMPHVEAVLSEAA
jgi:predicted transcriptional regulator